MHLPRRAAAGAAGGFAGALAGHWLVLAARAVSSRDDLWLKGAHGPPFFELTLSLAAFFAVLGLAGGGGIGRRLRRCGAAGLITFLVLAIPLAVSTRLFSWGETPGAQTWAWIYLVFGAYGAANAAGAGAIGWLEAGGLSGALLALAGGASGWAVDRLLQWLGSAQFTPLPPMGPFPPASALVSGATWGAGLAAALSFASRPGTAVLFDMDGVVIDSERHWHDVEASYLAKRLPQAKDVDQSRLMGLSVEGVYELMVREHGVQVGLPEFRELYRAMARVIYQERCTLMPGFLSLAKASREQGLSVGLVSSSTHEWIQETLRRFSLQSVFDVVIGAEDTAGEGKPSPALYILAAQRLGVAPQHCIAIEDSCNGVRSAKAAGMACVALRNGFNEEQDLRAADLEVRSLEKLSAEQLCALLPRPAGHRQESA